MIYDGGVTTIMMVELSLAVLPWWWRCHWRPWFYCGSDIALVMRGDTTLVLVQVSLPILLLQLGRSGLPASKPSLAVVQRTVWQWPPSPSDVTPGANIQLHPRSCQVLHFTKAQLQVY